MIQGIITRYEISAGDLERAIQQLPYVKDMPLTPMGYHPYCYLVDEKITPYGGAWRIEYPQVVSPQEAERQLQNAVQRYNGYGLTQYALNYMAAYGQIPIARDGLLVRIYW